MYIYMHTYNTYTRQNGPHPTPILIIKSLTPNPYRNP